MRKSFCLLALLWIVFNYTISTAQVNTSPASVVDTTQGNTYAFILGISNYKFIQPLNFADQDAALFRDFLRSAGGGKLKDEQIFSLLNEEAKAANFWVKGMNWLRSKNLKKGDRLYIYMAGHGDAINQDEYFFLTYDCNPAGDKNNYIITGNIQLYNLKSRISEWVRNGIEVVLIMDACRSNELPGGSDGQQLLNSAISEKKAGEIIMLATGAGQESLEDASVGTGHGLFTYFLVDGLSGLADVNGNGDKQISLKELETYIGSKVPVIAQEKYKRKQDPYFCCVESDAKNIAIVDSSFLRKWTAVKEMKNLSGNEMDAIARTVRLRGLDSVRSDSQFLVTYHQFNKAIKQLKLLGSDSSAEYYLLQLSRYDPENILTKEAQATLAAEFINYAQTKINLYLQGKDAVAVQQMRSQFDDEEATDEVQLVFDRMEKIAKQDFTKTAEMLEKAIGLLLKQDTSLAKSLVAKVYFFKAHGFFDKGNKTMDYIQAINYASIANKYDNNAAYTLNTLSSLYNQKQQFDSAVFYAKRAVQVAPRWRYPYLNAAYAYTKLNKKDSAIAYYRQAIVVDSSSADALVDLGRFYYTMRQLDSAQSLYEKALRIDPTNVYAHNNIGWILKERRQYKEAISHFKACVNGDANFFSAYQGLSKVFSSLHQYDSARFYYEKAMTQYPDKMITSNYLGNFYKGIKLYDSAAHYYRQAIGYDRSDPIPYLNLAQLYNQLKRYDSSVVYFKAAMELSGASEWTYNQLGSYYKSVQQFDSAIIYFSKAERMNPKYSPALNNLALTYFDQKNYATANQYFRKALTIDTLNAILYNNAALSFKEVMRLDSAKTFFTKAIDLNPALISPYINLGWVYRQQRKYDSAKYVFQKGSEYNPYNTDMINNLIMMYTYLDQYDSAKIYYQRNIALYPGNPGMLNNFGNFYFNIKNFDSAIATYKKAIALDPENALAYNNIGAVYNELSDYDSAVYYYRQAVRLDTGYVNAYFNMGMSFLNRQRTDSAIKYLSKAIDLNPRVPYYDYALSCAYALKKAVPESIRQLTIALEKGYTDFYTVLRDEDLKAIRATKEYQDLITKYVPQKFKDQLAEELKSSVAPATQTNSNKKGRKQ